MSDILYWNEARKELDENKLLSKCDTFVDSLMANGIAYPHTFDMNMDNVAGKTFDGLRREMNRLYKLLTKKLKDITPLTDEFQIHKGFLGKIKGANDDTIYLPLVLLFDDGQILTGLAKRYDDGSYKVVKWFLNDEDVTKSIYGNKTRDILADKNYNELAKRLAVIVNYNHKKFIRKNDNPIQKEIHELEKKKEELKARRDELLSQVELSSNAEQLGNSEELEDENNIEEIPNEDLTEVSEEPLVDTEETGAKVDEELGETPKITAKNIAEFYPNMSDDDIRENIHLLNDIFQDRVNKIVYELHIGRHQKDIIKMDLFNNAKIKGLEVFGVKDNLEPIDEYIAKIKASPEYQEYIRKNTSQDEEPINDINPYEVLEQIKENPLMKQILKDSFNGIMYQMTNCQKYDYNEAKKIIELSNQYGLKNKADGIIKGAIEFLEQCMSEKELGSQNEPTNEPQDNEIETKLKALLESDDYNYINTELNKIMENMSNEDIEKYEELMRKVNFNLIELASKGK